MPARPRPTSGPNRRAKPNDRCWPACDQPLPLSERTTHELQPRILHRPASADDDEVSHVDYWPVAEVGVDLVRGRVRLIGKQANPCALGLELPGDLGDCVAGPAASAMGGGRVNR